MRVSMRVVAGWLAAVGAGSGVGACAAPVVAAGAGAGAAYYLTSRGAEGLAPGGMNDVASRTQDVLREMGVTATSAEGAESATGRTYNGRLNDLDVSVELDAKTTSQTLVKATVKKNAADYEKETARQIVEKIVTGGNAASDNAAAPADSTAAPSTSVQSTPAATPAPATTTPADSTAQPAAPRSDSTSTTAPGTTTPGTTTTPSSSPAATPAPGR